MTPEASAEEIKRLTMITKGQERNIKRLQIDNNIKQAQLTNLMRLCEAYSNNNMALKERIRTLEDVMEKSSILPISEIQL